MLKVAEEQDLAAVVENAVKKALADAEKARKEKAEKERRKCSSFLFRQTI